MLGVHRLLYSIKKSSHDFHHNCFIITVELGSLSKCKSNEKKEILLFSGTSVLIFLLTSFSGIFGHNIRFIFTALLYFIIPLLLSLRLNLNSQKIIWLSIIMLLPPLLVYTPIYLISFENTRTSLLSSLGVPFGLISYLFFLKVNHKYGKLAYLIIFLSVVIWTGFSGYHYWMRYNNYNTWTGSVSFTAPEFRFLSSKGDIISNETMYDKIVVLDIWNTRCGICFEKFPLLQDKISKYQYDTTIRFIALNVPIKGDTIGMAEQELLKRGYSFELCVADNRQIADSFMVKGYPTVLIIKHGKEIIYRGDIENIDNFLTDK